MKKFLFYLIFTIFLGVCFLGAIWCIGTYCNYVVQDAGRYILSIIIDILIIYMLVKDDYKSE